MSVLGLGAQAWLHNGTILTQLAEVYSVKPPFLTNSTTDTTHHGSGRIRTKMATLADPGKLVVRLAYVPGSATDLLLVAAVASAAAKAFKAVVNAATGTEDFTGSCIPISWEPDDVVIDDKQTAVFTAEVSGGLTEAVSS